MQYRVTDDDDDRGDVQRPYTYRAINASAALTGDGRAEAWFVYYPETEQGIASKVPAEEAADNHGWLPRTENHELVALCLRCNTVDYVTAEWGHQWQVGGLFGWTCPTCVRETMLERNSR